MKLLRDLVSDGQTGKPSSKRFAVVLAAVVLALVAIVSARAVWYGLTVDPVAGQLLATIAGALAGVAGASYVGGKAVEAWKWRGKDIPQDVDEEDAE